MMSVCFWSWFELQAIKSRLKAVRSKTATLTNLRSEHAI
jgi:hypothetical protein